MIIKQITPGTFKLDGGATFGVVPKTMWEKVYPADEKNLCLFALRNLLIETQGKKILVDTGIGNKQEKSFYKHYFREGHHSIKQAVIEAGYNPSEISDVILTHLHFDHVGGAVEKLDTEFVPTFPNAKYHVSKQQWDWALNPNRREKASYLKENILPLAEHKVLNLIENETELVPGIQLRMFHGHTAGLMIPFIKYKDKTFVFTADLLALSAHIPASWVCGYDTRPLISFDERESFLREATENNYYLIFQHDAYTESCTLKASDKGYRIDKTFTLEEIL